MYRKRFNAVTWHYVSSANPDFAPENVAKSVHLTTRAALYCPSRVKIERPNQVWAADITYIPLGRGFLYLVAIIDWASRAVLAWRLSNTMDVSFCVSALEAALARYGKPEIFNTDQGAQFTSAVFTDRLEAEGIRISMDGRGRWMDNVFIERLWRSLKHEEVYLKGYADTREARAGIGAWMAFYNGQRPHQALRYRTPMAVWWAGVTGVLGAPAVDLTLCLDNAAALPTGPQQKQQHQPMTNPSLAA
jgi:putative transposase